MLADCLHQTRNGVIGWHDIDLEPMPFGGLRGDRTDTGDAHAFQKRADGFGRKQAEEVADR